MADKIRYDKYVRDWLEDERDYTIDKFGIDLDDKHIKEFNMSGSDTDSWWLQQLDNYYHRANVLDLTTSGGRQALAKFVATAAGMLEAAVRVYGPLPEPGVTSGENLTNLREFS